MPKSLVLGNGHVMAGFDKFGLMQDFYFPFVGEENQMIGSCINRVGIFVDNHLSWLSDGSWEISVNYEEDALVGKIYALNKSLAIELALTPAIYNEKNIFLERVVVKNLASQVRAVKLFFNQEFQLYENPKGDTVYYSPNHKAVIHYKGRRVIFISGAHNDMPFDDYAAGLRGIEGREGTYRDAEDGLLSKNPIEHGAVDSVIGFSFQAESNKEETIYYWFVISKSFEESFDLHEYTKERTPEHLLKTTTDFWRAWVNKSGINFCDLEENTISILKKSLLIIRAHVDNNGGILASADSDILQLGRDTYNYVWPRDAAFVAYALDLAGYPDLTKRFFEFCNDVITDAGYILHKYLPDQSFGSSWHPWIKDGQERLPIQEDETATVIWALWNHYQINKDLEFIEQVYNSLIKNAAEFMVAYRDHETNLPLPSFDLWEEKWGVHTYTAASVYGGLVAAASFADLLGKEKDARKYKNAADEVRGAILEHFYDKEAKIFYKSLLRKADMIEYDKTIDVSSFFGLFSFGVLDADDQILRDVFKQTQEKIFCTSKYCGAARYDGDRYHSVDLALKGNPWIITTLWEILYQILIAKNKDDIEAAKTRLLEVIGMALPSGILPEQFNPHTGEHISVAPLTWSHAELVKVIIAYLNKVKKLDIC